MCGRASAVQRGRLQRRSICRRTPATRTRRPGLLDPCRVHRTERKQRHVGARVDQEQDIRNDRAVLRIAEVCVQNRRGGAKSRSSYGGILSFHDLHCEIGYLFGPQEPRSLNPGGRQIFVAGNDDVYLSVLRKCHGFRQLDFATLDDCLVGEDLHGIQLITGSAGVAPVINQQRSLRTARGRAGCRIPASFR
jgi:hypothetical protein